MLHNFASLVIHDFLALIVLLKLANFNVITKAIPFQSAIGALHICLDYELYVRMWFGDFQSFFYAPLQILFHF